MCLRLRPCAYLCGQKWINRIFSKSACAILKIPFNLGLYNFLVYLKCVKSYAWSKGHSDLDLSSVTEAFTIFALGNLIFSPKKEAYFVYSY